MNLFVNINLYIAVYCYSGRHGDKPNDCNAKDGNPFGPFWDTFSIDFVKSEFYGSVGGLFDTPDKHVAQNWNDMYVSDLLCG